MNKAITFDSLISVILLWLGMYCIMSRVKSRRGVEYLERVLTRFSRRGYIARKEKYTRLGSFE